MSNRFKKVRNPGDIIQLEHNDAASCNQEIERGFVIGENSQSGDPGIHNDISSAVFIGEGRHLHITNRDMSNFQYVTFGDSSVSAASATNGVPVPPGLEIRLCSGPNEYVRGSSTDLHAVEIED